MMAISNALNAIAYVTLKSQFKLHFSTLTQKSCIGIRKMKEIKSSIVNLMKNSDEQTNERIEKMSENLFRENEKRENNFLNPCGEPFRNNKFTFFLPTF